MTLKEHLREISQKLDKWHDENRNRDTRNRYENLSYISFGFALATISIAIARPNLSTAIAAFIFVVVGLATQWHAAKFKINKE